MKFTIHGKPVSQNRPRFARRGNMAVAYEDSGMKSSKAHIQHTVLKELPKNWKPLEGPLAVRITAYFACPTSAYRKRNPVEARWKDNGPDADNIAKHYMDALLASGILAADDRQVASLQVLKIQAAQGESPKTVFEVLPLEAQE